METIRFGRFKLQENNVKAPSLQGVNLRDGTFLATRLVKGACLGGPFFLSCERIVASLTVTKTAIRCQSKRCQPRRQQDISLSKKAGMKTCTSGDDAGLVPGERLNAEESQYHRKNQEKVAIEALSLLDL